MSNFAGLSTGYSALQAHKRRLDVISENIANINTPGYHRQTVELESIAGPRTVGFWSGSNDVGGGVQVKGLVRAGSALLENSAQRASSVAGGLAVEEDVMMQIEDAIGGLADRGIRTELDSLWNGFDDLANLPEDLGVRQVTLEKAEAVARTVRSAAQELDRLHEGQVSTVEVQISRVNELGNSIAALDQQVIAAQAAGAAPNSLLDQRGQMITELASLVSIDVHPESDGQVSINIDGYLLVGNGQHRPVSFAEISAPPGDATGLSQVNFVGVDGRPLQPTGGSIAGLMNATNALVRADREALDEVAVEIATAINALHSAGVGRDGSTGFDLFEVPTGAIDMKVSDDLEGNPERLAAASAGGGVYDESNARSIADLADDPDGPSAKVAAMIDSISVRTSAAISRSEAAENSATYAAGLSDSSSGVSLDQELTELITAQRSYEAAARIVTSVDEMLRTLMSTGLVGR